MNELLQSAVDALKERFAAPVSEFRGEVSLTLLPERIVDACRALHDEFSFELLSEETAVDYWPQETPRSTADGYYV